MAEDQSKVYDELESYKLQLTAAEQIINESTETKRQLDLEIARLRDKLNNRDKTVEKMIKECTVECEERVRLERTQSLKIQNEFEVRINDLQREATLCKAAEERAKRNQQRAEINLQNERENSGINKIEEEINSLRIKCESLDRLRHESIDECRIIREEQTKYKLEFERELSTKIQKIDKLNIQLEQLKNDLEKSNDQKHNLNDQISNLSLQNETLKEKNSTNLSSALAEQAKKIEQIRAEAQHWKAAYEVLSEENMVNSSQLNSLYQKERNLNKKYRTELGTLQAGYEAKLRKLSNDLKIYKFKGKY